MTRRRFDDVRRRGGPSERVVAEEGVDQRVERRGDCPEVLALELRHPARGGPGALLPYRLEVSERAGGIGMASGEEVVAERPERIEIGALIEIEAAERLGRDEGRGASDIGGLAEGDRSSRSR